MILSHINESDLGIIFIFHLKLVLNLNSNGCDIKYCTESFLQIIIFIKLSSTTLLFLLFDPSQHTTRWIKKYIYIIANHERSYMKPTYSLNHLYSSKRFVTEPHPFFYALYSLYDFLIVILLYSYQLLKLTLLYMRTLFLDILSSDIRTMNATLVFVSLCYLKVDTFIFLV